MSISLAIYPDHRLKVLLLLAAGIAVAPLDFGRFGPAISASA
jgi:hypothetical protein